ncbi:TonB-dependent receptor [Mucilaginibacter sp. HMF5004]|uniref:TonB-dependent receptor n=1 Tax=Mucilaginibacter rivuli TaxID=2857527 RepID=UPI001C5EDF08|nr:TonB-dependent receptor [Mucilaginibacter rivuli]MBW4890058.1 TonB-dependent receptor [Mucilaginibacter rivuli]
MKSKIFILLYIFLLQVAFVNAATTSPLSGEAGNGTLSGKITDKKDGSPLIGVAIYVPDLKIGATTNAEGKYILTHLPKGIYLVQLTYVGYGAINQKVDFSKTSVLDFEMETSSIEIAEVMVTGVSRATEIKRSPIPLVAISKTVIDEHAAAGNIIDQIANLPGVSAVTTGPNVSKPFIHGLGYNRVVTLQDGIRQEGQQWGDEHGVEVDQNSIERVEVIKGPASLGYGSDAIGGVVNLITASPVADGTVKGSVQGVYGTNNGLVSGSINLQGNSNGFVWGTVLSSKAAIDYQNQHDGRVYATNFKENDARIMLGLTKNWGYSYLNASIFDDEQAIPDGSRDSVSRQFTKQVTEADLSRPIVNYADLNGYAIPVLHQHVQLYRIYNNSSFSVGDGNILLNLGYQYSHRREYTHPEDAAIPGLNLQLTTFTYDTKYNFNIAKEYETSVGVNGMYQTNSLGYSTDFPIPAYHQFDIGPFFIVKKSFGDLDLVTGARYDSRSFTGDPAYIDTLSSKYTTLYTGANPTTATGVVKQFDALSKNFSGFSGSFGATYNFSKKFLLKANIARGFRAPSIAELSANGPDPGSQIYHVGNSNFQPEFSVQEDFGAFLTLPMLSLSAELFNNDISNYIFQQQVLDATGASVITNGYNTFTYVQTKARIYGGELNMDIHPYKWLHFENSLSLTYGQNLGSGGNVADSLKYLPFIPPLHTHSELRGNFAKGFGFFKNFYAEIGFDHFNAQDRFFAAYGTETYTAGYNLISAGVGANIVNTAGNPILKIFIEGTNLGDVNYQSNMSRLKYFDNANGAGPGVQPGIFNMGRNVSFKVIVPFDFTAKAKKS